VKQFHRLIYKYGAKVTMFEPKENNYIWLELYLDEKNRKNGVVELVVKSTLQAFPGDHQFHFNPAITSLKNVAKNSGWIKTGKSKYFDECIAYQYRARPSKNSPALGLYLHRVSKKCPRLVAYNSQDDVREVISAICNDF